MTAKELKKILERTDDTAEIIIDCMDLCYNVRSVSVEETLLGKERVVITGCFGGNS